MWEYDDTNLILYSCLINEDLNNEALEENNESPLLTSLLLFVYKLFNNLGGGRI